MHFGPADWSFLPNEFECVQTVWLFDKMLDRPFSRNTIDIPTTVQQFSEIKIFLGMQIEDYFGNTSEEFRKYCEEFVIILRKSEKFFRISKIIFEDIMGKLRRNFGENFENDKNSKKKKGRPRLPCSLVYQPQANSPKIFLPYSRSFSLGEAYFFKNCDKKRHKVGNNRKINAPK